MTNHDPVHDAFHQRLMEKADSMGYRLVPKVETDLYSVVFKAPVACPVASVSVTIIDDQGRQYVHCEIIDGPRRL